MQSHPNYYNLENVHTFDTFKSYIDIDTDVGVNVLYNLYNIDLDSLIRTYFIFKEDFEKFTQVNQYLKYRMKNIRFLYNMYKTCLKREEDVNLRYLLMSIISKDDKFLEFNVNFVEDIAYICETYDEYIANNEDITSSITMFQFYDSPIHVDIYYVPLNDLLDEVKKIIPIVNKDISF